MLFLGIIYYCYWDVQLFDGYLVSSISVQWCVQQRGATTPTIQTLQYKIMKRVITINQILVYW